MNKLFLKISCCICFIVVFFNTSSVVAHTFPFREFVVGDHVPDVTLRSTNPGQPPLIFSQQKGTPYIVMFWGADLADKKARSTQILKELEQLAPFLHKRNIPLFSVNIQGDRSEVIDETKKASGCTFPFFVDKSHQAYGALGVYVMPAILLVNKDGNAVAGMGYSREIVHRLRGAVEVMLGEKSEEQVQAELHPQMKEVSADILTGNLRFNLGLILLKRGKPKKAIPEFQKALVANPLHDLARVELGCLYIDDDKLVEAEEEILKGLQGGSDSGRGKTCLARIELKKGLYEKATNDLIAIINDTPDNPEAHYYLGKVYEIQKLMNKAQSEYNQAYLLLVKKSWAD